MKKIKVMFIFGTRPETIKMAPLIKAVEKRSNRFQGTVVVTAQHREILDQPLQLFGIQPDYDLNIMTKAQSLSGITTKALTGLETILNDVAPDIVLIQGDTTTTFIGSLAAFYFKIPVGHVEAGLRTYNPYNPYPEEMNRRLTGVVAEFHFVPTPMARASLLREGIDPQKIYLTGNTVIDSLKMILSEECHFSDPRLQKIDFHKKKIILLTTHRRESFGPPLEEVMNAVEILTKLNRDLVFIFPIHYNPNVRQAANKILKNFDQILLIDPLDYKQFVHIMARSYLILTDSGGIQEEATALGKPTLVLRETTERLEGVKAGTTKLVGTSLGKIVQETVKLLENPAIYQQMARMTNLYGDGTASQQILDVLEANVDRLIKPEIKPDEFHVLTPKPNSSQIEFTGKPVNILSVNVEDLGVFNEQEIVLDILKTLDFLTERNTRATFFVFGRIAERFPEVMLAIRDKGHEIALQGYSNTLVYQQTPEEFRLDLERALNVLHRIIDDNILGYRAPYYSVLEENRWVWDILLELDFRYDSSVFPIKHDQYGIPNAPRYPFVVNMNQNGRGLLEFPLSTVKLLNENIPIAGGNYLRFYPYWFIKRGIQTINSSAKPAVIYLRTWEINQTSFEKGSKQLGFLRKRANFHVMYQRFSKLLDDFEFMPFRNIMGC